MTVAQIFSMSPIAACYRREDPEMTPEYIIETVADMYNMHPRKLRKKGRQRETVEARQIAMLMIRTFTPLPLKTIGSFFEGDKKGQWKDHTSVLHGIQTVKNLMETEPEFYDKVKQLKRSFTLQMSEKVKR